jgi:ABC-2 type transport system permease protein
MKNQLYTVIAFARLNTKRFFRDRLAIFFAIIFPLIFLFVFGGLFSKTNNTSFKVAVINQSNSNYATNFVNSISGSKLFKVDKTVTNLTDANSKMDKNQLDSTIIIPSNFGDLNKGIPEGQINVIYTVNSEQAGTAVVSILSSQLEGVNSQFVKIKSPFTVVGTESRNKTLTPFDYTFSGLLGFSILGLGIFGPINVFPELKKQGILRRFHTTPLRVWQYFLATMMSQAIVGLVAIAVLFVAAITIFHLKVTGNYLEIAIYIVLSIATILGIGLALGGWAKNERQAAPLSNIITFPLIFLSGTFFPTYLMPVWLQKISAFLPLTPVINGLRLLTTEGYHLVNLGPELLEIGIWIIIIYFIAFRVFRWE